MRVMLTVSVGALMLPAAAAAQTVTTTPAPTTVTTTPAPATPPPATPVPVTPAPTAPPPGVIAPGVTIAGVDVSGLTPAAAEQKLYVAFAPRMGVIVAVARGRRVPINPRTSGYTAGIPRAVAGAMNVGRSQPAGPVDIPVTQRVNMQRLKAVVEYRTRGRRVPARDATTTVKNRRLVVTRSRIGIEVDVDRSAALLAAQMTNRTRGTVTLPLRRLRPQVPTPPDALLVDRDRFRVTALHNGRRYTFPIAVGQPAYPTPTGNFRIVNMQRNPTWYPPDSRWAAGLGPVPPGAGNPLGTRWMGTSAPGIGLHGTPSPGSIGTRASHGCIRMYIRDAERLYELVSVGEPVYIR